MPSTLETTRSQHLYLTDVTWDYYEHLLELIGDGHSRVTYLDGEMEIISPGDNPFPVDYLLMEDVPWAFYEETLKQIGDRPLRVTYCDGRMEIMSPLPEHEREKSAFGRLVEALSEELDIDIQPLGSTTFRRRVKRSGFEPDECYYIQNESKVRDMKRFDPAKYPPPDLAIEVDVLSRSVAREPVLARLGVPELWRYRKSKLRVRVLGADGTYADHPKSLAFPFLPMDQFAQFVRRMVTERQNDVLRDFRKWARGIQRKRRGKKTSR
jgi:Uma2 family endonuclease